MKGLFKCLLFSFLLVFSVALFGEEALPVVSNEDFIKWILEVIPQLKGASPYLIAGIVVQFVIKIFSSEIFGQIFKNFKGYIKLTIVLALSIVSGVLSGLIAGETWLSAILNSATLSAFLVLFNQVYKQYFIKKA